MFSIKKTVGYLQRIVGKVDSVNSLARDTDSLVRSIGKAINDVVNGHFSPEEKAAIDKIEALRAKLLTSTDPVHVLKFGAGSPNMKKTKEEMEKGGATSNTVGSICRTTSKPPFWAQILFGIIRHTKVEKCLELGTSVGISGLYQASALRLNGAGVLKTMEGSPEVAEVARNNFRSLDLTNATVIVGRFQDNLDQILQEGNYDYAFVDGHHDRDATVHYFERIYQAFKPRGIMVFDDIKWSDGMVEAWNNIIADKRVSASIDLGPIGVCVIDKNAERKRHYKINL